MKNITPRLSGVQKDILYVLYSMAERKNMIAPIPAMSLLNILNQGRFNIIADTNFRRSCHTLVQHGYLSKYRDRQSLKLAFGLTEKGNDSAAEIYQKRLSELDND